jgi:hypothetical protein
VLCIYHIVTLSGLAIACFLLDPKFMGSNPAKDSGFLWAIIQTSFGEVKPSVPCHRFTACKRALQACKRRFVGKIQWSHFFAYVSFASLLDDCW